MSRIIFFRCRISEAREATVRQGLTEKNPPLGAQHYFVAQREAKKCGIIFRSTRPGPCRERLALTLCRKTVIQQRQQYGNDNFKEIVMGTSHRILKQRLRRAQQKQMHGASTIPITKKPRIALCGPRQLKIKMMIMFSQHVRHCFC